MVNRNIPPEIFTSANLPAIHPVETKLSNGISLYALSGGVGQVVKLDLIFGTGTSCETTPLSVSAMVNLFKGTTLHKKAREIEELLDFYGASFNATAMSDKIYVSITCLCKHLEKILELLPQIIFEPAFVEDELALELQKMKAHFMVSLDRVNFIARRQFKSQLFGPEHPYGFFLNPEHFDAVQRDHLHAYHSRWIQPDNLFIIASGMLPENIHHLLDHSLGQYNSKTQSKATDGLPSFTISPGQKQVRIEKKGAVQAAIQIGKRIISKTHPDFSKLEITNELLGGFFGSRLMQNIRQQKGLTYGIYSGLTPLLHDGIFVIRAQTSNQEVPIALQEIYEEIECLRTQPPSTIELENLRCYIAGRLMRSFDGPFALAERLKESLVFGLKYNYYQQALNTLNSISPEEISNMAYVYLNPADMIETVVSGDVDGYPTHGE